MRITTGIRSMTDDITGPHEHYFDAPDAAAIREAVKTRAVTGEGAYYYLVPDHTAEEEILRQMVAAGEAVARDVNGWDAEGDDAETYLLT